ncbi:cupin domain-containing protein [Rhizobium sp.]
MSMPMQALKPDTNPLFIAARPEEVELVDAPINPSWVVSGNPRARMGQHSPSIDGRASTKIWDCSQGSFWWTFGDDETVVILDGEVRVTTEKGEVRTLAKGDIAYFAGGTRALWEVDSYVRKIAFCRQVITPAGLLRAMLGNMKRAASGQAKTVPALGALAAVLPL